MVCLYLEKEGKGKAGPLSLHWTIGRWGMLEDPHRNQAHSKPALKPAPRFQKGPRLFISKLWSPNA